MSSAQIDMTMVLSDERMPPQLVRQSLNTPRFSKASRRGIRRGFFASLWPVLATRRVESSNALSQSTTISATPSPPAFLRSCLSSLSVSRRIDSLVHCMSLLYGKAGGRAGDCVDIQVGPRRHVCAPADRECAADSAACLHEKCRSRSDAGTLIRRGKRTVHCRV